MRLSDEERARVDAAVRAAEAGTAGEIVCVVAGESSDYRLVPMVWAALLALALPWPLAARTEWSVQRIHLAQLAAFAGLVPVLSWPGWRMALVPGPMRRRRAHETAVRQFQARRLGLTRGRTGVLVFVSWAERYAEVIADEGVASRVDGEVWREAIDVLTDALRRGRPADGLVAAVAICGRVLAAHAPRRADDADELPNAVVEL